jgi:FAD synthase
MSGDNWVKVDSTFTVGASPTTGFFTFNNADGASTGKIAYIDNYELYDITSLATSVNQVAKNTFSVYASDKKIVAKFDLESASDVTLSVYNVSGMLLESKKAICTAGTNVKTLNSVLPSGVYMVKMSVNGKLMINKIIL